MNAHIIRWTEGFVLSCCPSAGSFSTLPISEAFIDFCIQPIVLKLFLLIAGNSCLEVKDLGLKILFSSLPGIINSACVIS